jgi:hypothetical protein
MDADKRIQFLMQADAYPHPVVAVQLVETHLSWVFLTGRDAYKVKKPVHFDFVDFSTLDRRKYFCDEEFRCNQTFAPELYVGVVPIVETPEGKIRVGGTGQVLDWAVHMRQFSQADQADRLLERDELGREELRVFGSELQRAHDRLPPMLDGVDQTAALKSNFDTLRGLASATPYRPILDRLEVETLADIDAAHKLMIRRHAAGFVRECHGDLHLANLVRTKNGIRAFDCLEFDIRLRHIDIWCDASFLFMDCAVRARNDLAYAFVDGYLDASGDYEGATLLPLYARYRSMVRAKVAALRLDQSPEDVTARKKLETHVNWAEQYDNRPPGKLFLTCGLSGTGKSYWATRLVPELKAVRLRSDVLRKRQHGLNPNAGTGSGIGKGLYTHAQSERVYQELAELSTALLTAGENVIIDAANLRLSQRQTLYRAARAAGSDSRLLYLTAQEDVLKQRLETRRRESDDPSEADAAVLAWQQANAELPTENEPLLAIDTQDLTTDDLVSRILYSL